MLDTLPALPALAALAAPPAPQPHAGGKSEARAFARELERARPKDDAPARGANVNNPAHRSSSPPANAANGSASGAAPAQGRPTATAARSRSEPAHKQSTEVDESATGPRDKPTGEPPAGEDAAADLSSLLASLMAPPPATEPVAQGRSTAGGAVAAEADKFGDRHRVSAPGSGDPLIAAPAGAALAPGTSAAEADTGTGVLRAMREDTADSALPATSRHADAAMFALPQPTAAAPSPLPRADAAAPAPYAAQIAAPVGSPDFAPGLSAQLSVMVRDGLHEARLQLNPAEMGPITVQIQLDGQKAQVTLVAEQAPTRQALEQAMPTLASALREGGLTLTGGGVFEQAPSNAQQQPQREANPPRRGSGQPGGVDDPLAAPAALPARAGTRRGVLDLYA